MKRGINFLDDRKWYVLAKVLSAYLKTIKKELVMVTQVMKSGYLY
ncbi:hypothetical protein ABEV54_11190 [Peribacillus psychrosaccharolyticus]|nr:hypothetical protein [Peribacillus psychrosaccharolyticus]MEC2057558.1 hypothetical protein [Peribacillus psychrosaccharolyticus]MED3746014.1 hypothetical protein [Peribacillus psychrosaccharolyticus]